MKFFFTLLFLPLFVNAQEKHLIPKSKWSKNFYLSDEFCASKGLTPGETNQLLRAWNAETKDKGLFKVVNMIWYFNTTEEANQYLKLNLPVLSESGDPVSEFVNVPNVSNLYVYSEGAGNRSLNKALGITNYMYFFLFTVHNYVAKVFVSTEKKIGLQEAGDFAREAARRLNESLTATKRITKVRNRGK